MTTIRRVQLSYAGEELKNCQRDIFVHFGESHFGIFFELFTDKLL